MPQILLRIPLSVSILKSHRPSGGIKPLSDVKPPGGIKLFPM